MREVKEEVGFDAKGYREIFRVNDVERGENCFFLIDDFAGGEPKLSGPEAKRANQDNQFILTWVAIAELSRITLYPESAKKKVMDMIAELRRNG